MKKPIKLKPLTPNSQVRKRLTAKYANTLKHKLFDLDQLPEGKSLSLIVEEQQAFAVRSEGQICVYLNSCPHLGVPLDWQPNQFLDADGELIQCATHGALFLIDSGECVSGPCAGDKLQSIAVETCDGGVYLK